MSGNRFVTEPFRAHHTAAYAIELLKHHLALMPGRADYALAAVRANHLRFYQQIMLMDRISEARIYPGLKCPMYLLASNVEENLAAAWERTPALRPEMSGSQVGGIGTMHDPDYPETRPPTHSGAFSHSLPSVADLSASPHRVETSS